MILYFSRLPLSSWHFVIAELADALILLKNAPLLILGSLNVPFLLLLHKVNIILITLAAGETVGPKE